MTVLNGWHPGEQSIHDRLNVTDAVAVAYTWIDSEMPEQHRLFYTRHLPFVPLTTLDREGRPWGGILAGKDGKPGFIRSPSETKLVAEVDMWQGDPLVGNLLMEDGDAKGKGKLAAGIGVEFSTRRRNKFAGKIVKVEKTNEFSGKLYIEVDQAIGNCPKYINIRDLIPHPRRQPWIVYERLHLESNERMPEDVINFITGADTVFLGSVYHAKPTDDRKFPSHVGMNQRGGRPGFIRVRPSDGRTIVIPDYSGNRLLTSLGNIEASSLASMTFIDFVSGDVLYSTGTAHNLIGPDARAIMPRQNVVTMMKVTGYVLVRDALPARQRQGVTVERSLYSPPIKFLSEEKRGDSEVAFDDVQATLSKIEILSNDLARFWFETSQPIRIVPGQAAVLSFSELLGKPGYAHMAPGNETSVNDDRVRTWTVSSAHGDPTMGGRTSRFAITMREKPGGLVTGALFSIARQASRRMPEVLADARGLGMKVPLAGITGEFTLRKDVRKVLWVAGGIGVTPFLSMLEAIAGDSANGSKRQGYDILFLFSTREPDIMLPVIRDAVSGGQLGSLLSLHLFTSGAPVTDVEMPEGIKLAIHMGRFNGAFLSSKEVKDLAPQERLAYVCGTPGFEEVALEGMRKAGLDTREVVREGFAY